MVDFVQRVHTLDPHDRCDPNLYTARVALGEGWEVEVTYRESEGKLIASEMTIAPREELKGTLALTADVLRSLKLGEVHAEVAAHLAVLDKALVDVAGVFRHDARLKRDSGDVLSSDEAENLEKYAADALREAERFRRPHRSRVGQTPGARPRYPDSHYAHIAMLYLKLQSRGETKIIKAIAEELSQSDEPPTEKRVKSWVEGTTRRKFLGPGTQGKAGRTRGDRFRVAEALLRANEEGGDDASRSS